MTPTQHHREADETKKPCNACGCDAPVTHMEKQGWLILRCPECGLQYLNARPGAGDIETLYGRDYFDNPACAHGYDNYLANEKHLKRNFAKRAALIGKYKSGGRLLDAGCGPGFFLETLPQGWSGTGVEVSGYAVSVAAARGLDVRRGSFAESDFPPGSFDAVCLWDVLEHLDDPARALARAADILNPGGILALSTGDASSLAARVSGRRWHLYALPEHLYFFSRPVLERMLARAGFSVEAALYETLDYSVAYLVERLFKMCGLGSPERFVPRAVWGLLNKASIPVNLYDIITVIARKK